MVEKRDHTYAATNTSYCVYSLQLLQNMSQHYYTEIKDFLYFIQFERKYSEHTFLAYQNDLEQFAAYLASAYDAPSIQEIKAPYIRSWLAHLKTDKTLTNKSLNRKISTLKSFFKYLMKKGYLSQTPMTTIISPKINKRLPSFIGESDMEQFFKETIFEDSHKGRTEYLILQLFYQTGMRVSELVGLKETDIDEACATVKVLGKGNKERLIPASKDLLSRIKAYINEKPVRQPGVDRVFCTDKGKPFVARTIYNIVKAHLSNATTIDKKSPHILRHTFATHLMNNGAELNAVKDLLGHSSLAATQVYTHLTIEKLKEVYQKAHPKA